MRNLTEAQRRLLGVLELRGGSSLRAVSREAGLAEHTVRYQVRHLQQRGLLERPRPFVDMPLLGFNVFGIYFSLAPEDQVRKEELLRRLVASPWVLWVIEIGGDYQYGVGLCARETIEVVRFFNRISTRVGNIFFEKSFSMRLSYADLGRGYLGANLNRGPPLRYQAGVDRVVVENRDLQLLSELSSGKHSSSLSASRALKMPNTTFERRRKRLEQERAILGYVYRVQAVELGMQLFKILIYVKGINPKLSNELFQFASKQPEVVYFVECVGEWDYEIGVEVVRASDVTHVTENLCAQFSGQLKTTKALPVFRYLKWRSFPDLTRDNRSTDQEEPR